MMTFEEIYKKYNKSVLNAIKKIVRNDEDAEELASEAMIRIHKNLPTYREDLAKVSTWVFTIAKNVAIDFVRKKKLETVDLENTTPDWDGDDDSQLDRMIALKSTESNPEEVMIFEEVENLLMKQFQLLNETDKEIANLRFFKQLSYKEISAELAMPLGTVKAKLHRAKTVMISAFPEEMRKVVVKMTTEVDED